jgi:hypothetical protein
LPDAASKASPTSSKPANKPASSTDNPPPATATDKEIAANQALGQQMAAAAPYNWSGTQWVALNNVVEAESGWNTTATNASSGAYGIPQSLPGSKMAAAGTDWKTDPKTQIKWMLLYIMQKYGSPQAAWDHEQAYGWY